MKSERLSDFHYDFSSSWSIADVLTFSADETSKPMQVECVGFLFRLTYILKIYQTTKIVTSYIANQLTGVYINILKSQFWMFKNEKVFFEPTILSS